MARSIAMTITAAGTYTVPVDSFQSPFNLAYSVELAAGATANYQVNYTLSDPNDASWTPIYLPDPNLPTAQTATKSSNFASPVRALQLVVNSVTGSIRFTILQGMSSR